MTRSDLETQLASKAWIILAFSFAKTFVRCATVPLVAYILRDTITQFAGRDTLLALHLAFLGDVKFALSLSLAGSAAAWALLERWLRHRKTSKLQSRIIALEKRLDPKRSSSHLTVEGRTNPLDKS